METVKGSTPDYETIKDKLLAVGESDLGALVDLFELLRATDDHKRSAKLRKSALAHIRNGGGSEAEELYNKGLLWDAKLDFDCYLLYTESKRAFEKQFYLPRRKQLKPVVDGLQALEDDILDLLAVSLPPGSGKTTLALFYLTWKAGKHPEKPMLTGSHANSFLAGAYAECIRIMTPGGEYLWNDVFPGLSIINTNAKDMMIDIGVDKKDCKRFTTLEFSSIGSGNAGKVRAEQLLYCDDLVPDLETALSKERLDKLWGQYTTDFRQRKIGDCKELHIATRWSVHDVIGRLENEYGGNGRSRFIVIPALDENDESNFDYPIAAGFTTKFFHEQRDVMDDASFKALYMGEPIEREGQLYPEDEFRRYYDLPDREPDAILAVTDTKDVGTDFCCMPIAYQYGTDFYIEDVVYENYAPQIIDDQLVAKLIDHRVQACQFESNAAGGRTADKVQERVKAQGGITKITKKFTTTNKQTKILVNSPFVKEHFLFKDNSMIKQDKEYRSFLSALTSYTMAGKNKNDDAPDAMAQLSEFVQNLTLGHVSVISNPFRR